MRRPEGAEVRVPHAANWPTSWAILIGITACLMPPPAHASGQLPAQPVTHAYNSKAACLAALQDFYAEDRRQVVPKTVGSDGRTSEVTLETNGVQRTGHGDARYESTLWFHNGGRRPDLQQTETSHSFQHRIRTCDRNILRVTGEDGYTTSTFALPDGRAAPR